MSLPFDAKRVREYEVESGAGDSGLEIPIRKQPLIEALVVNLKIPRAPAADLDPASPPSSLRLSSPEN